MFFGFAVAVILKRIFQQKTIRADAVIGALCIPLGVGNFSAYILP